MSQVNMKRYQNYCNDVRVDRTQFDKDLQNMWCPSCCGSVPTGPTGPMPTTPNSVRYNSASEDRDYRGNVNVAGVN